MKCGIYESVLISSKNILKLEKIWIEIDWILIESPKEQRWRNSIQVS